MALVQVCMYCRKILDPKNDEYVEVRKEHEGTPQQLAHVACYQRQMEKNR